MEQPDKAARNADMRKFTTGPGMGNACAAAADGPLSPPGGYGCP